MVRATRSTLPYARAESASRSPPRPRSRDPRSQSAATRSRSRGASAALVGAATLAARRALALDGARALDARAHRALASPALAALQRADARPAEARRGRRSGRAADRSAWRDRRARARPSRRSGRVPSPRKPHAHGFIAPTTSGRAGNVAFACAREIVTTPSSSGWRSASRRRAAELGELVEEEDAVVREAHLAGSRPVAAADEAHLAHRVVRRAEGTRADEPARGRQEARDAVDRRDLERLCRARGAAGCPAGAARASSCPRRAGR